MKNIFIILVTLLFFSCVKNSTLIPHYKMLNKDKEKYPSFLVDFFPDTLSKVYLTDNNMDTSSLCISFMTYDFNSEVYPENYLTKYNADDSLLITIKRETVIRWDQTKKVLYNDIFVNEKPYYPIPFFEEFDLSRLKVNNESVYSNETISGLSKDFCIYILDSKSGHYWDGLKPLYYMPEGWKNGYTKGLSINNKKKITIYWFILW